MLQKVTVALRLRWQCGAVNTTAAMLTLLLMAGVAAANDTRIDFEVRLDGRPVGTHRFEISRRADGAEQVRSVASFDVKFLGFVAYRYRHQATESWTQGCLSRLQSTTDDNGRRSQVDKALAGSCVSSYAYWDLARLQQQRQLLNPQTGELDPATMNRQADAMLEVRGVQVPAQVYRLRSDKLVIDLWYSKQGEWLQLESTAGSGRKLQYRRAAGDS